MTRAPAGNAHLSSSGADAGTASAPRQPLRDSLRACTQKSRPGHRHLRLCARRGSGSVTRVTRSDVKHCLRAHGNRHAAEIVQHREGVLPTREHLVEFVHHRLEIPLHVDRSSVHARDATRGHAATLPAGGDVRAAQTEEAVAASRSARQRAADPQDDRACLQATLTATRAGLALCARCDSQRRRSASVAFCLQAAVVDDNFAGGVGRRRDAQQSATRPAPRRRYAGLAAQLPGQSLMTARRRCPLPCRSSTPA